MSMPLIRLAAICFVTATFAMPEVAGIGIEAAWETERREVYQYEVAPLTLRITHPASLRLESLRITGLPAAATLAMTPFVPQRNAEQRIANTNEQPVKVIRYRCRAVAEQPGKIAFEPKLEFTALEEHTRSYFFTETVQHAGEITPGKITLNVGKLPEEGRPPAFGGAVGRFTLESSLETAITPVVPGSLLTLRSVVAGEGNIGRVKAPHPIEVHDFFRVYDAREVIDAPETVRVFERVFVPTASGSLEIPALRLDFFDPQEQRYVAVIEGPFPVTVEEFNGYASPPPSAVVWRPGNEFDRADASARHAPHLRLSRLWRDCAGDKRWLPWVLAAALACGFFVLRKRRYRAFKR